MTLNVVVMAAYLCKHYTPILDVTQSMCHKAFITCVERNSPYLGERKSVGICHTILFDVDHNLGPFKEFLK